MKRKDGKWDKNKNLKIGPKWLGKHKHENKREPMEGWVGTRGFHKANI